ncbi:putative nodulation protein noeI-putative methyltransferase [Parvularcula bermudensis HTCC2503]|uniref:Putative nodulation protein noeI-putative methyltransferase n=1 Tax=Parvularcula bermudensis (strain ATCC BAA-594 / HTCC2503 / KCTC 12087) TaxID=314260 RepID=E0TC51_PARBH|nr:FkbM family methyltransferase [Parvularcula bermudensis]ADM10309.1 putative nodulation protein noeI-putative methyltransferase [Parvularcula bermudensis HTCC2503]
MKIGRFFNYYRYYAEHIAHRLNGKSNGDMRTNGEFALLEAALSPGACVVDIGMNKGEWLQEAYGFAAGAGARFIGVDANPAAIDAATRRLGERETIEFVQAGVSDAAGRATFFIGDASGVPGDSSLFKHYYLERSGGIELDVEITTLDTILADKAVTSVDFMKMDIEGSELPALRGATEALAAGRIKRIQMEYNQTWLRSGSSIEKLFDLLKPHGFRLFRLTPSALLEMSTYNYTLDDFVFSNLVAVLPGYEPRMPIKSNWHPLACGPSAQ